MIAIELEPALRGDTVCIEMRGNQAAHVMLCRILDQRKAPQMAQEITAVETALWQSDDKGVDQ